jgi:FlaA1/EpsC-like NDP-sugar epimerase
MDNIKRTSDMTGTDDTTPTASTSLPASPRLRRQTWRLADMDRAELMLCRARDAMAFGRYAEAMPVLEDLQSSLDRTMAIRATLQMVRLDFQTGRRDAAVAALEQITIIGRDSVSGIPATLTLELAHGWSAIDEPDRARETYERLLSAFAKDPTTLGARPRRYAAAIAHYRLGQMAIARRDFKLAYENWKSAFEQHSDEILPYAAFALASQIASRHLTPERIEWMYMHAIRSSDLELSLQARRELAEFLAQRCQYKSAREHLTKVSERGDDRYRQIANDRILYLKLDARTELLARAMHDEALFRRNPVTAVRRVVGEANSRRVIIVGAGTGGRYLLEALENCQNPPHICGFVDDDTAKITPLPYPLLGTIDKLAAAIRHVNANEVLMAIPTASGKRRLAVVHACREIGVPLRNIPAMHDLFMAWDKGSPALVNQLRRVTIEQIVGDEYVGIDDEAVAWAQGRRALVIGAGGVGGELCRRLAHGAVESLAIVGTDEDALQRLTSELEHKYDFPWAIPIVEDCLDAEVLRRAMERTRPSIVIHAAGLASERTLERNPYPAARRDVMGARAVALASSWASVPCVLYVSDTRAARRQIFGAIKALSEEAMLAMEPVTGSAYAVVRIDPPMGTTGCVLNRIATQIEAGTPVTVPQNATARFLSRARTAELILHVARMMTEQGLKGRLTLDAGPTMKVLDLAEEMVLLHDPRSYFSQPTVAESRSEWTEPPQVCGEPVREERDIVRIHRQPLPDTLVDTLLDELMALPQSVDEIRTLEVRTHEFARTIMEYLADLPPGVESSQTAHASRPGQGGVRSHPIEPPLF